MQEPAGQDARGTGNGKMTGSSRYHVVFEGVSRVTEFLFRVTLSVC